MSDGPAQFPPIVLGTMTRHGVEPNRGWVTLPHSEALVCRYPGEPDREFQVLWTQSDRPARELFDALTGFLRDAGARRVQWWFRDDSTPAGLEELVLASGATTVEDQVGVAREVGELRPLIAPGVSVSLVQDAAGVDAVVDIGVAVFDEPRDQDRRGLLSDVLAELDRGTGAWVVGMLDGVPVGRARATFSHGVAPLTGAAVLPSGRRRGVYAAMLAARLDLAALAGCRWAVTKARRDSSLPVLLREGFDPIGSERAHELPVD
ncbi:hypothetical protein BCF74_13623 [Knoellia remsis]|uniref:N-acetyltransferase domain-containing protein n=1 Tax=Knoellia remsis TaxID=407159 RepID=A0A2T0U0P4_9MICO|nr:GNAT family N-acetyltransferase [Knoellia remsis]PRY51408.1 hypothetical protein BCF74_13623 [Knoellia remsis]